MRRLLNLAAAGTMLLAGSSVVSTRADAQTLDQQERCSMLAKQAFQKIYAEARETAERNSRLVGADVDDLLSAADYQFNTKIGKCLMLVDITRDDGYLFEGYSRFDPNSHMFAHAYHLLHRPNRTPTLRRLW